MTARTLDEKARAYRTRRHAELERNLDSPDGLRKLVDSLIGDVWRARRERARCYEAWAEDLDARAPRESAVKALTARYDATAALPSLVESIRDVLSAAGSPLIPEVEA